VPEEIGKLEQLRKAHLENNNLIGKPEAADEGLDKHCK
jgi:hypothetical protein